MKGRMSQTFHEISIVPKMPVLTGVRISMNSVFCRIYEYVSENHPHLFMAFLMVGIPLGSIIILALMMIVIASPLILVYGW